MQNYYVVTLVPLNLGISLLNDFFKLFFDVVIRDGMLTCDDSALSGLKLENPSHRNESNHQKQEHRQLGQRRVVDLVGELTNHRCENTGEPEHS